MLQINHLMTSLFIISGWSLPRHRSWRQLQRLQLSRKAGGKRHKFCRSGSNLVALFFLPRFPMCRTPRLAVKNARISPAAPSGLTTNRPRSASWSTPRAAGWPTSQASFPARPCANLKKTFATWMDRSSTVEIKFNWQVIKSLINYWFKQWLITSYWSCLNFFAHKKPHFLSSTFPCRLAAWCPPWSAKSNARRRRSAGTSGTARPTTSANWRGSSPTWWPTTTSSPDRSTAKKGSTLWPNLLINKFLMHAQSPRIEAALWSMGQQKFAFKLLWMRCNAIRVRKWLDRLDKPEHVYNSHGHHVEPWFYPKVERDQLQVSSVHIDWKRRRRFVALGHGLAKSVLQRQDPLALVDGHLHLEVSGTCWVLCAE